MNWILNWLFAKFLFAGTMFFAAGATTLTDGGADGAASDSSGVGDAGSGTGDAGDAGDSADGTGADADASRTDVDEHREPTSQEKEEPELAEFKGAVSNRLRGLAKQAPELAQVFQKYPKIQEQMEAVFRREAALREVFPTVAEARQLREALPNGVADLDAMKTDIAEVEQLDSDFYTRDQEGNFPGHANILHNMHQDSPQAMVSLLKTATREWAKLDPDSYNDVMGRIVGSTLSSNGVPEYLADMIAAAKEAKHDGLTAGLTKLANFVQGYLQEKPKPTADQEKLARDRQAFEKEKGQRSQEESNRFHGTFLSESKKLQLQVINDHPAMKKLAQTQGVTPEKRAKIAEEVRSRIEKLLSNSRSFMSKLRPAYGSRNLQETINLQKSAWSQPWLLNKMVRDVLRVETPALIEQNRESVRRRAGAPAAKPVVRTGEQQKTQHTKPYQLGKNWFWPDGRRMSLTDIMQGKHEQ